MLKLENAMLLDICLGYPFGKLWFPAGMPEVKDSEIPNTFLLNGTHLASLKKLLQQKDLTVLNSVEGIRNKADLFLSMRNPTVVEKNIVPSEININDYYSLPKYLWPNPFSSDGRPYEYRDGEVNPACYSEIYDLNRFDSFSEACLVLSIAHYFTDEHLYAEKVCSMLETWFVNESTKQTPHFKFAQYNPNRGTGRFQGLIEARRLIYVCEAIQILKHTKGISDELAANCTDWFLELVNWMETSPQGEAAKNASNNIGFWVDLQRIIYLRFCGQDDVAVQYIREVTIPRMNEQIDEDGKVPKELTRAKPYDYTAFTLLAMAGLSANITGLHVEEYSSEEGRNFNNAFKWFSDTIKSNDLQEKGVALAHVAHLKREISHLRALNKSLEEKYETELQTPNLIASAQEIGLRDQELQFAFNRTTERLQTYEKDLKVLRTELVENQLSLITASVHYRSLEYLFSEQKNVMRYLEDELKSNHDQISQLQKDLQAEIENSNQLKEELDKMYETEARIKKEMDELASSAADVNIPRYDHMLLQRQIEVFTKELSDKRKENETLSNTIHKQKVEMDSLNKKRKTLIEESRKLKRLCENIESSRSWKYTKPIRTFFNMLRKPLRRV